MISQNVKSNRRKRKLRKFYDMTFDYSREGMPGYLLQNIERLAPGHRGLLAPSGRRGFQEYPEAPRFLLDEKVGRLPQDLELYYSYWLVSDRTKSVFEAVDQSGFAFLACEVQLPSGKYDGPGYWLCDVVRVLDAVDEAQSRLKIGIREDRHYVDFGKKYYSLAGGGELTFRESKVGNAHVFRMMYLQSNVICDQLMKDACEASKLKGVMFRDASKL